MATGEIKALLRFRIIQSLQRHHEALSFIHIDRVENALDGNTSRDQNGKAFGVNDNELELIERVLSRLLYEVENFPDSADYEKWKEMIQQQCEELDHRIEMIYPVTSVRHSHRH